MKTDNQIISKARGECRHEHSDTFHTYDMTVIESTWCWCPDCGVCVPLHRWQYEFAHAVPNYSTLSAWTPELYKWIEDEGLQDDYITQLDRVIYGRDVFTGEWLRHRATPAQKASALAQAIKERDQ